MDQESSYDECNDGGKREGGFRLASTEQSGGARRCDLVPNQIFEDRKSEGGLSQERSPFTSWGGVA